MGTFECCETLIVFPKLIKPVKYNNCDNDHAIYVCKNIYWNMSTPCQVNKLSVLNELQLGTSSL